MAARSFFTTVRATPGSRRSIRSDYYERMAADSGGMEQVREKSSRAYLVPGMGHCTSGATLERFDLLGAVVNWVEDGKAPEFGGRDRPGLSRPQPAALCLSATCARTRGRAIRKTPPASNANSGDHPCVTKGPRGARTSQNGDQPERPASLSDKEAVSCWRSAAA